MHKWVHMMKSTLQKEMVILTLLKLSQLHHLTPSLSFYISYILLKLSACVECVGSLQISVVTVVKTQLLWRHPKHAHSTIPVPGHAMNITHHMSSFCHSTHYSFF